jgi:hypothetical protein
MAFQSYSSGRQLNKEILASHTFPLTNFHPPVLSNIGAWHMIGSSKIAQETSALTMAKTSGVWEIASLILKAGNVAPLIKILPQHILASWRSPR